MYKERASQKLILSTPATLEFSRARAIITLTGCFTWSSISETNFNVEMSKINNIHSVVIEATKVEDLDSVGVYFIFNLLKYLKRHKIEVVEFNIAPSEKKFFDRTYEKLAEPVTLQKKVRPGFFTNVGMNTSELVAGILSFIVFFGQFCVNIFKFLKSPLSLNWQEVSRTINDAGAKGVGVSALLCFLIGLTLAYEMSPQFITYGANVYIVNFLGISLLKEVTPLLTAIIVAGRTGASITAEIGVMKVQEEIDAIKTMGISPIRRLVLPKVIGVMIAVPLITAIADVASMVGGAIVADASLGVDYSLFLARLQNYVPMSNFTCGIIKSVAFAMAIALIGCFCGFEVKGNANSIGEKTTKSVVLGIILVVILDAIFAMIFKTLGI